MILSVPVLRSRHFLGGSGSPRFRSRLQLRPNWVSSGSRQKNAAPGGSATLPVLRHRLWLGMKPICFKDTKMTLQLSRAKRRKTKGFTASRHLKTTCKTKVGIQPKIAEWIEFSTRSGSALPTVQIRKNIFLSLTINSYIGSYFSSF